MTPNSSSRNKKRQHHPAPKPNAYYKPSAYTFTCRGGFHLKNVKQPSSNQPKDDEDLESKLQDVYICNGIQTKLKHVADYPLARSKDEAIRWFEGSNIASELHNTSTSALDETNSKRKKSNAKNNAQEENDLQEDETFSSYGTTRVNILTVEEIPVSSVAQRQSMDPFAGFGPLSPMNPFGSIFGGFFGDPWNDTEEKPSKGWMRGSRSVSSSTRMGHDENGKRISTTVTTTTTVDGEGNKKTETETIVRHLDDGGRVERRKEIRDESERKKQQQVEQPKQSSTAAATDVNQVTDQTDAANAPTKQAKKPLEIAVIATDCLLGMAVTDSKITDSTLPNLGDPDKWRKTEYFFKLGRFFPTLGVVSQYYSDKDQQQQYDKERQKQKKSRWDKSAEKDKDEKSATPNANFPVPSLQETRVKYYFDRTVQQMEKNLDMMKVFALEMTKPDFPKKVYYAGEKILDNIGPTAERTGKLMKDVFAFWFGRVGWGDDGRRR